VLPDDLPETMPGELENRLLGLGVLGQGNDLLAHVQPRIRMTNERLRGLQRPLEADDCNISIAHRFRGKASRTRQFRRSQTVPIAN
jgi:hypothetical protein